MCTFMKMSPRVSVGAFLDSKGHRVSVGAFLDYKVLGYQ